MITGATDGLGKGLRDGARAERRAAHPPRPQRGEGPGRCSRSSAPEGDAASSSGAGPTSPRSTRSRARRSSWRRRSGSTCWSTTPASAPPAAARGERRRARAHLRGQLPGAVPAHPAAAAAARASRRPSRIVNVSSAGQAPIDFDDVMLERGLQRLPGLLPEQAGAGDAHLRPRRGARGDAASPSTACTPAPTCRPRWCARPGVEPVTPLEDGVEATMRLVASPGAGRRQRPLLRRHQRVGPASAGRGPRGAPAAARALRGADRGRRPS